MKYFLAIDIGASSGRHMLATLEGGIIKLEEIYRFANGPVRRDGGIFWDSERLFTEIIAGLRRAGELGKIPESVAIDTWGVDYVLIDLLGNKLSEPHSYRDTERWDKAVPAVHAVVSQKQLYSKTGIQMQSFNTVYQLWADKCEGKLDRASAMLMMPEYFNYRLTGIVAHESSNASTSSLINTETYTWDTELIRALGYPERLFQKPMSSSVILGEFSDETAALVGYRSKVALAPSHDTASAVLGSVANEGELFLSSGTWSLLGVVDNEAHTSELARSCDFTNEGYSNGKFLFLSNIIGLWMVQQLRHEEAPELSFSALTELARESVTAHRVNVNDSRFLSPENMKREIESTLGTELTLGESVYVALASLAECYGSAIRKLEVLSDRKYETLNIMGGGSKNTLLNELTEASTGKRVVIGPTEATVVGNIASQMIAAGIISNLDEAKRIIKASSEAGTI